MLRPLILAAILALSAGLVRAQVTGPIPNTSLDVGRDFNWGGWSTDETSRAPTARDIEIERRSRETVSAKIPDRKGSKDPWRNLRQVAPVTVPDRHRVDSPQASMPTYRILVFDYGHINASHTVEAAADDDAIKAAHELQIPSDVEVWERDRFVARLKPQQS